MPLNKAKFVALSSIQLPQGENPMPIKLGNPPCGQDAELFTCVIETGRNEPIFQKNLIELKGPIKFIRESQLFVSCNIENGDICIFSTSHWRVNHEINVRVFITLLQGISRSWIQMKMVKSFLLQDYFILAEQVCYLKDPFCFITYVYLKEFYHFD